MCIGIVICGSLAASVGKFNKWYEDKNKENEDGIEEGGRQRMSIILYTTHCPKCMVLEKKLALKNIHYEEVTDKEEMLKKGFSMVPILEVNGVTMDFKAANTWINEY